MAKRDQAKRGPDPERLKAEGANWKDAIKHALRKKKPEGGWPKAEPDDEGDDKAPPKKRRG